MSGRRFSFFARAFFGGTFFASAFSGTQFVASTFFGRTFFGRARLQSCRKGFHFKGALAPEVRLLFCAALLLLSTASIAASRPQSQTKAPEKPSETLAKSVHHQIQVLPFYSVFDNIEFRIDGNRVTLTGQVLRTTLKANAEAAVKDLEGVTAVSNQIEVLPPSPSDDDLRTAVYRVLFEDDILKKYAAETVPPIHIIVKDGNIALTGTVQNDSDRKLAATLTAQIPNIKSIQNRLTVKSK